VEGQSQRHPRSPLCSALCSSDGFRRCRPDPVFNVICPPPSWSALFPCASYIPSVELEGNETICCHHMSEILQLSPLYVFQRLCGCVQFLENWKLVLWSLQLSYFEFCYSLLVISFQRPRLASTSRHWPKLVLSSVEPLFPCWETCPSIGRRRMPCSVDLAIPTLGSISAVQSPAEVNTAPR